jgi:hypothetical protein
MAESIITDKAMQARPGPRDLWLVDSGARGEGRLVGRVTPAGERRLYFRYTDSSGVQVRLLLGGYDPRGDASATFTVQQARDKARSLSAIYRSGIRDLREHLAQQHDDAQQAKADEKSAEAEQARLDASERERQITVRTLFERWRAVDLQPQLRADGKRVGRKDGGQYALEQFERHVFGAVGDRFITDVRKADLMAILDGIKASGRLRTCNDLLANLKQMIEFAVTRDIVDRSRLAVSSSPGTLNISNPPPMIDFIEALQNLRSAWQVEVILGGKGVITVMNSGHWSFRPAARLAYR